MKLVLFVSLACLICTGCCLGGRSVATTMPSERHAESKVSLGCHATVMRNTKPLLIQCTFVNTSAFPVLVSRSYFSYSLQSSSGKSDELGFTSAGVSVNGTRNTYGLLLPADASQVPGVIFGLASQLEQFMIQVDADDASGWIDPSRPNLKLTIDVHVATVGRGNGDDVEWTDLSIDVVPDVVDRASH